MQSRALCLRCLLLCLALLPAVESWWDEGHILTAAVALRHVSEEHKEVFQGLLSCHHETNFTDLATAAAWLDHIKCKSRDAGLKYCQGGVLGANYLFSVFHVAAECYAPDKRTEPPSLQCQAASMEPDSYTHPSAESALKDIYRSLKDNPPSSWSMDLEIRMMLHIWGDVHQPLHTSNLYNDCFPDGDTGGNSIPVTVPESYRGGADMANLHGVWDGGGGALPESFPVADVESKAEELEEEHPPQEFIGENRLSADWDNKDASFGIPSDGYRFIHDTIEDTRRHLDKVYKEFRDWLKRTGEPCKKDQRGRVKFEKAFELSEDYMKMARTTSKQQVALGGYRLASWLNYLAQYLKRKPSGCPMQEIKRLQEQTDALLLESTYGVGWFAVLFVSLICAGGGAVSNYLYMMKREGKKMRARSGGGSTELMAVRA